MSKFSSRINKLIVTTHVFISYREQCLIRDYYKARLDELTKPEDFEEKLRKFHELMGNFEVSGNMENREKANEILKLDRTYLYHFLYKEWRDNTESNTGGMWVPKSSSNPQRVMINDAKKFFKAKKSGELFIPTL
jgi:hypothetical protein